MPRAGWETYTRENQAVALDDRATEEVRLLAQLTERRNRIEAERSAIKTILDRVNEGEGASRKYRELAGFPTFLENPIVAELVTNLMDLENRRSELALRRSASNPDVVAVDSRIREVETQLHSVATSYELAMATQVSSLDQTLRRARRALGAIPEQQAMAARLRREADLLGDLYRTLETRLQEAEVAQAVNLPGVRVVGEASMPFKPSSPAAARQHGVGPTARHRLRARFGRGEGGDGHEPPGSPRCRVRTPDFPFSASCPD